MARWKFTDFIPPDEGDNPFDRLLKFFKELLLKSSGDVGEALAWLTELDNMYNLTDDSYGMADFIQDLKDKGYIKMDNEGDLPLFLPTSKLEIALRHDALENIFGQLSKARKGNHSTNFSGTGDEKSSDVRPYEYGDRTENIALTESIRNAHINHGIDNFSLTENDLQVNDTYYQSQASTVLMIDISHSMILYGEDRITPAKRVAMALSELIMTRYPKDTLDVIVFGNEAWPIEIKDLPYLKVGPYHTNTVAGLELAMEILRKRKNPNKQIMMITDGKPTCIKVGKKFYKNAYGLDRKILNRTFALAAKCRKLDISITTFMIAQDPYLISFVDQFTDINQGKAFYSSLDGLGEFVFMDYKRNKSKRR